MNYIGEQIARPAAKLVGSAHFSESQESHNAVEKLFSHIGADQLTHD